MCGIAGYLSAAAKPEVAIEDLVHALVRRGPDSGAVCHLGQGAVGAARLEIIGGSAGAQPLSGSGSRESVLVFNGEIHDWEELAARIGLRTSSDTEVVERYLELHGREALRLFHGPFAISRLFDDGRRLLLARDPFGQRPLYWARMGETLVFASEPRAFRAAGFPLEPDEESLASLLRWQFLPPGRSLWRGINALRPGEVLEARVDGPRLRIETLEIRPVEESNHDPLEAFATSLARQGRRDLPAVLMLSGGLDSTVIAMGLRRHARAPERSIVGYYPDAPESDERAFARIAAAAAGTPLDEVAIDAETWFESLPFALQALEEPVAGPGAIAQWMLAREAARDAKIVYGGTGGDELFGGYERLSILQDLLSGAEGGGDPAFAPLRAKMRQAAQRDPGDRLAAYRAAVDRGAGLESALGPFGRSLLARRTEIAECLAATSDASEALGRAAEFEMDVLLPGLLQVEDRTVSWFGMESRAPFLDPRFASAIRSIPLEEKSPAAEPRRLFRRLFGDYLPPAIAARRRKLGFPVPLARFWRGPLRSAALDLLGSRACRERGIVDPRALPRLLEDDGAGGRSVYFLLMLELVLEAEGIGDAREGLAGLQGKQAGGESA